MINTKQPLGFVRPNAVLTALRRGQPTVSKMANFRKLLVAGILTLVTTCSAVDPAAVYDGGFRNSTNSTIQLRIGNGGAGQSGLIGALADAFIKQSVANGSAPFKVAWYQSDTTYTINYLQSGTIDVGITYNPAAEQIAIDQGIATSPSYYAFRDHFLLVGPASNPANISKSSDIQTIFSRLQTTADNSQTTPPVRFLSRYDKSATNIKESILWAGIGQVPWATAYSTWYHQYIGFPIQALTAAILLQEYTITDRGTILSLDAGLRNQTVVYKAGTDNADDPLLNPAHLLVGKKAPDAQRATAFAKWLPCARLKLDDHMRIEHRRGLPRRGGSPDMERGRTAVGDNDAREGIKGEQVYSVDIKSEKMTLARRTRTRPRRRSLDSPSSASRRDAAAMRALSRSPAAGLRRPRKTSPSPSLFSSAAQWRRPASPPHVSDADIAALASQHQHPLSLADLVRHGRPPLSETSLLSSANFTLSLLPIRLARRLQALRNLPYIVVSNPNISRIYNNYLHSLSILLPYWHAAASRRTIASLHDEIQFTNVLAELVATHTDTIPILARGFLECRRYIAPADVTRFLDEHLRARIGTRLVAEQHIALHFSSQPHFAPDDGPTPCPEHPSYIGVIDTALRPARTIESCAGFVADICELRYGSRPRLCVDGEPDTTFAFVPTHLEYIVTELLKNAFRATVETRSREPIVVTMAPEPPSRSQPGGLFRSEAIRPFDDNAPGVTIRIRDRGGGIHPAVVPNIWSYSFTTFSDDDEFPGSAVDGNDGLSAIASASNGGSSIAGLGYGLPLSRAYAEYFGGGIAVQSLYGWGTDVYLRLKGVGTIDT
ncbi:3-methyl-2-oxobutanoate dehydrogenase [lipoamide] kinase, mitochondrial [Tolypocladium capitatum]|uniref:Protein-serine/threonine kinase n=1 Tax=Tolypocladium capitatum TaxID=45235 RepID=A0A2K3Q8Y0_9HYPO|nr:3-methyl-2-oxobutanoate dehydrogenase [lipoamide] kinase, mitochondrial [Tolypocladium capitatum]